MMKVCVKAGWAERWLGGAKARTVEGDGLTPRTAAVLAGIPADEVGLCETHGALIDADAPLEDGATIEVYPPIIGG